VPATREERLYSSLQRGMLATQDLAVALPLLAERREKHITQAIADFRAKKLDGVGALLFVATLSENLHLKDDLEHAERQGRRSAEQLS
jgi:hypothetical protein